MDLQGRRPGPGVRQAAARAPAAHPLADAALFRAADHDAELSEEEFRLLRDFIHEQLRPLLRRLASATSAAHAPGGPALACSDLLSFEDYYRYLRFAPGGPRSSQRMVSHLTNNETYFFREQPQLQVFADTVLRRPQGAEGGTAGERTLRVLSAGCSTGEEALTLAMIVYDSGAVLLELGREGVRHGHRRRRPSRRRGAALYHQNSLPRVVSPAQLERHFVSARRRRRR